MWSRRPLVVVLALLVVVLALLTSKINRENQGTVSHHHGDKSANQPRMPLKISNQKLGNFPKLKPINAKEITTRSGLTYQDIRVGTGPNPRKGDMVVVDYTGWKPSGQPFDSTKTSGGMPLEFRLGQGNVIKGWDEGIRTMKVGGKRRLIVPPNLAYGEAGRIPVIEPNLTLIFDVELLSIEGKSR